MHTKVTKEKIRAKQQANGKKESEAVVRKVEETMLLVTAEIGQNAGIYPLNAGRVSGRHLMERSGFNVTTLYNNKKAYADLILKIRNWVESTNSSTKSTDEHEQAAVNSSRLNQRNRLHYYMEQNKSLQDAACLLRLEIQQASAERDIAKAEAGKLRTEIKRLNMVIDAKNENNVISIIKSAGSKPKSR